MDGIAKPAELPSTGKKDRTSGVFTRECRVEHKRETRGPNDIQINHLLHGRSHGNRMYGGEVDGDALAVGGRGAQGYHQGTGHIPKTSSARSGGSHRRLGAMKMLEEDVGTSVGEIAKRRNG